MVGEIPIYFEGDLRLREGFRVFLAELAAVSGVRFKLVSAGATPIADFLTALKKHPDALNILLIDSEEPYRADLFESVCQPRGISQQFRDQVFWTVQCM